VINHTGNHCAKAESCELISSGGELNLKFQNFRQKCDFFLGV